MGLMTEHLTVSDATGLLDRILGFFSRAESKANSALAINLGMLGFAAVNTTWSVFSDPYAATEGMVMLIFVAVSFWFIYWTFFPDLESGSASSVVYFGGVASHDRAAYVSRMSEMDSNEYRDEVFDQVWRNSDIVNKKFVYVKRAFWATLAAVPFWALYLLTVGALTINIPIF